MPPPFRSFLAGEDSWPALSEAREHIKDAYAIPLGPVAGARITTVKLVHAEDRRVSANAQWQGGQGDGREARILRQGPQAVFKVLV
jgi:hypothetical protein